MDVYPESRGDSELQGYLDDLLFEGRPGDGGATSSVDFSELPVESRVKDKRIAGLSHSAPDVKTRESQIKESQTPLPLALSEPKSDDSLADKEKKQLQALLNEHSLANALPVPVLSPSADVPVDDLSSDHERLLSVADDRDEFLNNSISQENADDSLLLSDSSNVGRALAWHDNGRPAWAQESFDVLLFTVSGLTLAVPLISLGQIVPLSDELTPIFGQSEWFMGLLPSPMGKLKTINTALFVMPERYQEGFLSSAKYVVSLDGQSWGLAVDSVNQPIRLDPDEVNWRAKRSARPWLAGTVRSHMCALIDIPQMAALLSCAEANSEDGR